MTTRTAPDHYVTLGVSPDASTAQIKKAYRTLAKRYHPDVNPSSDAAARFREITEAYDTLIDPDRRRRYDRLRGTHTRGGTPGGGSTGAGSASNGGANTRNGSSTGSNGTQTASRILKILEDTWMEIRRWHPEIPMAVIIIASGTDGKQTRLGHHAPGRWSVAGEQRAEVMISGEGLRRSAREVLGTLLHEAAHALADVRGIKDTSRQGRYHNTHFKTLAGELGLITEHDNRHGWSASTITPHAERAYARQLADLTSAMTMWRHEENTTRPSARRNSNLIAAICPCGRSIRAAASTLAEAPIMCTACGEPFTPKNADV
jgi:curved DNA-binding protein CbpA